MRIVAGQFKGRPIQAPKTDATRPTSDRARESLFNMIAHAEWTPPLDGARVLDLFAGSGALGLEALSRGASFCVFVDNANVALTVLRKNLAVLGVEDSAKVQRRSAAKLGDMPAALDARFDIAFLDPPYKKGLVEPCLKSLLEGDWLASDALVVVETAIDETPGLEAWELVAERVSGAAKFWFLKLA
ncbi:MAG: 16S rRNA (guanine(966)-N(2))-methyltransferase RsmD [Hyphomonas sp.]|nr:16S rRNA (guanine(966)-N(2))-methyltransferase RsmD [Hyphomonas sp.]